MNLLSRRPKPSTPPLSLAAAAFLFALAAASAPRAASASEIAIPLAKLGLRNFSGGALTVKADTRSCALRAMENANYAELLIPEGEFDCDASSFSFGLFGEPGAKVVSESARVEPQIDGFGRLERFVARGQIAREDGTNAEPFELVIMALIVARPVEYAPASASVVPGSFSQAGFGDLSEYSFKVVYETDERAGDLRFLLNREVLITNAGAKEDSGFRPFEDAFLAGTSKTYPVSKALRGASVSARQGVYRSVSIGEDAEGRLFVVEYEVVLSPETAFSESGLSF